MEISKLNKLIKLLRKNGIAYYKDAEVELRVLETKAVVGGPPGEKNSETNLNEKDLLKVLAGAANMPTEEDFLFYSSGIDLKAERENHEKLKETA